MKNVSFGLITKPHCHIDSFTWFPGTYCYKQLKKVFSFWKKRSLVWWKILFLQWNREIPKKAVYMITLMNTLTPNSVLPISSPLSNPLHADSKLTDERNPWPGQVTGWLGQIYLKHLVMLRISCGQGNHPLGFFMCMSNQNMHKGQTETLTAGWPWHCVSYPLSHLFVP